MKHKCCVCERDFEWPDEADLIPVTCGDWTCIHKFVHRKRDDSAAPNYKAMNDYFTKVKGND